MTALVALASIGLVLAVAFLAALAFRRFHVPDVLWLLLFGAFVSRFGLADAGLVQTVMPLLASLALIMILFDGALEVTPARLRRHGALASGLSVAILAVTTVLGALLGHFQAGLHWAPAILLGMCFGGAGIAIIVPLAQRMRVSPDAMTIILLEAVTSDILVIVAVFMASHVLAADALGVGLAVPALLSFGVAAVVGTGTGWAWSRFLSRRQTDPSDSTYVVTLAVLLLLYAATEALHGSGALAVLLFGILVGNARARVRPHAPRIRVFGRELIAFHHELVFLVRAFFFVSLGALTDWSLLGNARFLLTGFLLAVAVAVARAASVRVVARERLKGWDRNATAMLFPLGIVTAAVSVLPTSLGVPGTELLPSYATVVIVLTNLMATVAVFVASMRKRPALSPL